MKEFDVAHTRIERKRENGFCCEHDLRCCFIVNVMVNVVGYTYNHGSILDTSKIISWVHIIYQPTLYSIGAPINKW